LRSHLYRLDNYESICFAFLYGFLALDERQMLEEWSN